MVRPARAFLDVVALGHLARPSVFLECLASPLVSFGEICATRVVCVFARPSVCLIPGASLVNMLNPLEYLRVRTSWRSCGLLCAHGASNGVLGGAAAPMCFLCAISAHLMRKVLYSLKLRVEWRSWSGPLYVSVASFVCLARSVVSLDDLARLYVVFVGP